MLLKLLSSVKFTLIIILLSKNIHCGDILDFFENSIEIKEQFLESIKDLPELYRDLFALDKDAETRVKKLYQLGLHNEDVDLNCTQLIKKYGHPVEVHEVESHGYLITLFRIPSKEPVVYLQHGLFDSSDTFILPGPESGIAYALAKAGYDVWMGNMRGNKYARNHVALSPDDSQFWDFSWDEGGNEDLPIIIDYVLKVSGKKQLKYVGHSQGTTMFYILTSMNPEYNEKVSVMVSLAPIAWMSRIKSPLIRLVVPLNGLGYHLSKLFGINELAPSNDFTKALGRLLCGNAFLAKIICSNISFLIVGFNYAQLNVTNLPVIYSHSPHGGATKQVVHYGQEVESGRFRRFDYGILKNLEIYGSESPPDYPVEKITTKMALFHSDGDWMASKKDIDILVEKLPNVIDYYRVPSKNFNHLDFIWAKDIKKFILNRLLMLLKKY